MIKKRFFIFTFNLISALLFNLFFCQGSQAFEIDPPLSSNTDSTLTKEQKRQAYIPDTVYLKNDDQITGKILSFEQGQLKIDGQGPGVVRIKWHKISTIGGGNRIFKVEDVSGHIYIGQIDFSKIAGEIIINDNYKSRVLLVNVVRIFPLEEEWYRGLKGDLGAGVNYTKSSEVLQINSDYNIYYVISKWRFINNFSYVSTTIGDDPSAIRVNFNLQEQYSLPKRWVASELSSISRNDELGIKSRLSFALGAGNNVVQTERQRLLLLTGIAHNSEKDIESNTVKSNFEWPFSIQHTIYSFVRPDFTSTTSLSSFVGLTDKGRFRFDASTDIGWEFITNLKLKITFYYNYDNKSLQGKLSTFDYGTVLSLSLQLK